jgi:hypothetical protein
MDEDNPHQTDAELLGLLNEQGGWMARAGAAPAVPRGSLREALRQAFNLLAAGLAITHIVKLPDDAIEISAPQIRRLWQWIGRLNN